MSDEELLNLAEKAHAIEFCDEKGRFFRVLSSERIKQLIQEKQALEMKVALLEKPVLSRRKLEARLAEAEKLLRQFKQFKTTWSEDYVAMARIERFLAGGEEESKQCRHGAGTGMQCQLNVGHPDSMPHDHRRQPRGGEEE